MKGERKNEIDYESTHEIESIEPVDDFLIKDYFDGGRLTRAELEAERLSKMRLDVERREQMLQKILKRDRRERN